jgi:uncharacterized NAD-dependent epimerase/dehydratase family protein
MHLKPHHRIALLMHEGTLTSKGKTGLSMLRYSTDQIVSVIDYQVAGQSLSELTGIPKSIPIVSSVQESLSHQPDVLAIGIAPSGGKLPEAWFQEVAHAIQAGLSVVNGLHTPMADHPALTNIHRKPGQWIWDVRQEPPGLAVGTGQASKLACKRILTVGTDMSVGKMSTTLELHQACQNQGLRSTFIATGQTGLMLGYDGIPLDAVRVDFASGAVEQMLLKYGPSHDLIFIEGQGSLLNPASTATLPLIRGSQPTHLVLVHRADQPHILNCPDITIPPLEKVVQLYEQVTNAAGAFAPTKVVGIALNTSNLKIDEAKSLIKTIHAETKLPCTDIYRFGVIPILEPILAGKP